MNQKRKDEAVNAAILATIRVLTIHGQENPDWTEWRDLKDALLKLHPFLDGYVKEQVGRACSSYNEELVKVLRGEK